VRTATEEHVFASFFFRDHTHSILREVWRIHEVRVRVRLG
jgi:hypothetical protein